MILLSVAAAGLLVADAVAVKTLRSNNRNDPSKLTRLEQGDFARSVVATGKVQPLAKVEVESKASGIVRKILVDYGQMVRQGQVSFSWNWTKK